MRAERRDLASVLPHSGHAVFVREIVDRGDDWIVCSGSVDRESPFAVEGWCASYVALELAAQASAALGFARGGRTVVGKLGYLVRLRDVDLHADRFRAGEALRVRVEKIASIPPLFVHRIAVTDGLSRPVVSGTISVFDVGSAAQALPRVSSGDGAP